MHSGFERQFNWISFVLGIDSMRFCMTEMHLMRRLERWLIKGSVHKVDRISKGWGSLRNAFQFGLAMENFENSVFHAHSFMDFAQLNFNGFYNQFRVFFNAFYVIWKYIQAVWLRFFIDFPDTFKFLSRPRVFKKNLSKIW